MNEDEFTKLLDNTARLTIEQHCKLLSQLHYVYRNNYPNFRADLHRAVAWRVKQAWQLLHFYLNPTRR